MFIKKLLYSDTVIASQDLQFQLNYYITQDCFSLCDDGPKYGIIVEKQEGNTTEVFKAVNCITSITKAESILACLHLNTVSPICAEEALEIIMVQQLAEEEKDIDSASVA